MDPGWAAGGWNVAGGRGDGDDSLQKALVTQEAPILTIKVTASRKARPPLPHQRPKPLMLQT